MSRYSRESLEHAIWRITGRALTASQVDKLLAEADRYADAGRHAPCRHRSITTHRCAACGGTIGARQPYTCTDVMPDGNRLPRHLDGQCGSATCRARLEAAAAEYYRTEVTP